MSPNKNMLTFSLQSPIFCFWCPGLVGLSPLQCWTTEGSPICTVVIRHFPLLPRLPVPVPILTSTPIPHCARVQQNWMVPQASPWPTAPTPPPTSLHPSVTRMPHSHPALAQAAAKIPHDWNHPELSITWPWWAVLAAASLPPLPASFQQTPWTTFHHKPDPGIPSSAIHLLNTPCCLSSCWGFYSPPLISLLSLIFSCFINIFLCATSNT